MNTAEYNAQDITGAVAGARNNLKMPTEVEIDGEGHHIYHPRRVLVFNNEAGLDTFVAEEFRRILGSSGKGWIAATGNTMVGPYKVMTGQKDVYGPLLTGRIAANLDEVHRIQDGHPFLGPGLSFRRFMDVNLFGPLEMPPDCWIIPDGRTDSPFLELEGWRNRLEALQSAQPIPFALALLGIGPANSPHIAFMPHDTKPSQDVMYVALDQPTMRANSPDGREEHYFADAFTMGPRYPVFGSERILSVAKGSRKAGNIRGVLFGDFERFRPASMQLMNPEVTMVLDREAARLVFTEIK